MIALLSLFNITLTIVTVILFSITKDNFSFLAILTPFVVIVLVILVNFSIWRNFEYKLNQIPMLEQKIRSFSEAHQLLESILNNIDISISLREKNSGLKYTNYYFLKQDPNNYNALDEVDALSADKIHILNEIGSKKHIETKKVILNNKTHLYEFIYKQIDQNYICSTAYKISNNFYFQNGNNLKNNNHDEEVFLS